MKKQERVRFFRVGLFIIFLAAILFGKVFGQETEAPRSACGPQLFSSCLDPSDIVCDYSGWKVCLAQGNSCGNYQAIIAGPYSFIITPSPSQDRTFCVHHGSQYHGSSPTQSTTPSLPSQPQPSLPPRYTCVDKKTSLCQEDKSGVWADKAACEAECKEKEVDTKSCKDNYQKQRSEAKAQRTLSSKLTKEEYPEEIEKLLQDIIREAKTIEKVADENIKKILCDSASIDAFEEKTGKFSALTVELEAFLAEEEKKEVASKLSEEFRQRAIQEGFRGASLEQNSVTLLLKTIFSEEWGLFDVSSVRRGVENLVHIGAQFQGELGETKEKLFQKLKQIEKVLNQRKISDEEKLLLKGVVEFCLRPIYNETVSELIQTKFTQIALDIQKGDSLKDIVGDLQDFCLKRNAESNQLLYEQGALRFNDVDTYEWYFEVFQNPKQIAIKGARGEANPKGTLKIVEALLATLRTTQTPKIEEGTCGAPDIPKEIEETPVWGACALHTALKQMGRDKQGLEKLRLAGSIIEPVTREQFALFVWHLTRAEVLTQNALKVPGSSDIESLCHVFKDCGTFSKDEAMKEAVTAMKVNELMVGKGGDEWGFGQTLLRAEAAKVLLLLQEKILAKTKET